MLLLNNKPVEFITFPNKETRLDLDESLLQPSFNEVIWKFEDNSSIMELLLLNDILVRYFNDTYHIDPHWNLYIPYMPYSRMDRINENTTAFSLDVFLDKIISTLTCKYVYILDPHSPKTLELAENHTMFKDLSIKEYDWSLAKQVIKDNNIDITNHIFVFPDKGAAQRYNMSDYPNTIVLDKVRDFATGKIESIVIGTENISHALTNESKIFFVDDLCSYGGTFVLGLKALRNAGYNQPANLIVSHSEEGLLLGDVLSVFDKVYTTESILVTDNEKVVQYTLDDIFGKNQVN